MIEKLIKKNVLQIKDANQAEKAFHNYWDEQKQTTINQLCTEEKLKTKQLDKSNRGLLIYEWQAT